jgi:transcriptional regulator with XRE-family HTH domain
MDTRRVARLFAAVRREKGLRQVDVGRRSGLSQSAVSRLERGRLDAMTLGAVERVARALDIDLRLEARWRGGAGDQLVDRGHARLVEWTVARLRRAGWEVVVEFTFNHFGERGSVDVLAFHAATRSLLLVEVKTRLQDLQAFLSVFDRKNRVVPGLVARELGWDPASVSRMLVLTDTTANRSLVERHRSSLDLTLPGRAADARRLMRDPGRPLGAIWFVAADTG